MKLIILFLSLLTIGADLSFATSGSLGCSSLLNTSSSLEFAQFTSAVRKPQIGNRLNLEGLNRWVEAHHEFGPDYIELASFLATHIEVFSHSQFEGFLKSSMEQFLKSIPKNQPYFIIAAEEKTKSQLWVAHLVSDLFSSRPPENVIVDPTQEGLDVYIREHPNYIPLIVDDAAYMGQNLTESLRTVFNISYDETSQNGKYKINSPHASPLEVHIVVAAIAKEASASLKQIEGVQQHWSHAMPDIEQMFQSVVDPIKRERIRQAFLSQYGPMSSDYVLTGFAHKTADMASILGMSSDETYEFARSNIPGKAFSPRNTPHGTTVLEGVLLGPDNLYRDTIPILDTEKRPYGNSLND